MDTETLCYLSLTELAARLHTRELSSAEVTRASLERIRALNPHLHGYLTITEDAALKAAEQADRELSAGRWRGPLHGVPIAVKDLCWTRGVPTTCASRVLRDWRPDRNATVVDRLDAAGAVPLGKLNMTEFAVAWYHPDLPIPLNPWGDAIWPGASSSGSGVATAAGMCFASLGSDTGGSIRFPSAACGIVGLKPTWGRVSRYGVFPLGESLDHIGPLTRTVADAAAVLGVIAGLDSNDPTSLSAPVEDYAAALERGLKGVRIGIDEQFIRGADASVADAVLEAVRVLESNGARIVAVKIPDTQPGIAAWNTICTAETVAAHEATYPSRTADYGAGFLSFLKLGTTVRGQDYAKAYIVREGFANRFQDLFQQIDLFACPTSSSTALPANSIPPDASFLAGPNPLVRFTAPFNLSRNPTLSLPCGPATGGPPPSLQLVGRLLGEATLVQAGAAYERATDWHRLRPPRMGTGR